ncbi:unnamed protein product [Cuscuta campestris]|uniref:Integrase catalytic domain-containing protein n=1 Tax=Cuscuta campestris TaxID=132261 RepID=A0A484N3I3_9ASTE|nr:unnamed protein product [Cuscuta campestris]
MAASTYHKELYAIVESVQRWRQYLLGREFMIRTDHQSLRELLQQVVQTPDQHFYIRKLLGYQFKIEYKSGAANRVVDALSRRDEADQAGQQLLAISSPVPNLMEEIRRENTTQPDLVAHHQEHREARLAEPYSVTDGVLYYKRRMRTDVKAYVQKCHTCETTKYSTQPPAGLLQPLPVRTQVWEDISMDFVTGLPPSRGYTVIMVVVDRLTKVVHLGALPAGFDAHRTTHLFIDIVVKLHDFPKMIVSDRDRVFLSNFWREALKASGTTLTMSTSFHPQTDGQTEVMNRVVEQYLRAFTQDKPARWTVLLLWAEYALNTSVHSGLKVTPFEALYGRPPPSFLPYLQGESKVQEVNNFLQERDALLRRLRENLKEAQRRMTTAANKHQTDLQFKEGEWVLLKLQPYRQHSVVRWSSQKLARRYYGPYRVAARDDATWEPYDRLRQRFPTLHLEDKVVSQAAGNVTHGVHGSQDGGVDEQNKATGRTKEKWAEEEKESAQEERGKPRKLKSIILDIPHSNLLPNDIGVRMQKRLSTFSGFVPKLKRTTGNSSGLLKSLIAYSRIIFFTGLCIRAS